MANACRNLVTFHGNQETIEAIKTMLRDINNRQDKDQTYYLPSFVTAQGGHMWDISCRAETVYYKTRWDPNTAVLRDISDHFKVGFTNKFEEWDMRVFGQATYENGVFVNIYLESEDYEQIEYGEEFDTFSYGGQQFESEHHILEILLKNKIDRVTEELRTLER